MLVAPLDVVAAGVRPYADLPGSLLSLISFLPVSAPDAVIRCYRICSSQQSC